MANLEWGLQYLKTKHCDFFYVFKVQVISYNNKTEQKITKFISNSSRKSVTGLLQIIVLIFSPLWYYFHY